MSWHEFLLFVHIACAVIWLGGAFTFQIYGMAVRRDGDPDEMARFAGRAGVLGERMFTPAALIVVLAGVGLMIEGSWGWGELWVVFALVTFAASFVTGLFAISPLAKKLPAVAFMYAILFAMAVKPTGDDMWTVLGAAGLLVVLTAIFVAPLRGPRPEAAPATD